MVFSSKVSIVIPCYNQGQWLLEALSSIEQFSTSSILEVIIVNDGSTDPGTLEALRSLSRSKYTLLNQANCGLAAARNRGIELARAEFVLPLDADNALRGAYFGSGLSRLVGDASIGVVYGNASYFGGRTGDWIVRDFRLEELIKSNFIDACALFRKSAWESVGGYDERMPVMGWEDWDFWLRLANRGWGFVHIDEIAFDYRVREDSMIATTNLHSRELQSYIFSKSELHRFSKMRSKMQMTKRRNLKIESIRQALDRIWRRFCHRSPE